MQKKLKKISIGFIGYGNMASKRHQAIKTLKKYKTSVSYIIDKKIKEDKTNKYFKSWNKVINIKTDLIITDKYIFFRHKVKSVHVKVHEFWYT